MKKIMMLITIITSAFMLCSNVYAETSAEDANLKDVVNDSTGNLYQIVDTLVIAQEDIPYLDTVDFTKFQSLASISITECYGALDGSKVSPSQKINLAINKSAIDLSTFDFTKFNSVRVQDSYDTGNKIISSDIINHDGLINSEYNIPEKYNDELNKIAKQIYSISSKEEDIIKNVTLYVVNNLEYDLAGTYTGLPLAESIFEHKMGVCAHYAYFESLLLNKLGVFALNVEGYTDPNNQDATAHGWVMVYTNNDWYGIDPTWIDNAGKVFTEISEDNTNYMAKISESSSTFNQQHHLYFTLYNEIPADSRVSRMSIIDEINKDDSITDNNTNSDATIIDAEDTSSSISTVQKILGYIFILSGVLIISIYYFKKRQSKVEVSK